MININIEFYNKETEFIEDTIFLPLPDHIVVNAMRSDGVEDINELSARMFDVTDQMKEYVVENHPEHKEKFDLYDCDFMGEYADQYEEE
ncbi:MAG: hypothetical protein AAF569_01385 [Pseudomonadota bacterium]